MACIFLFLIHFIIQMDYQEEEDEKGLFTFYRQQAQMQEQIKLSQHKEAERKREKANPSSLQMLKAKILKPQENQKQTDKKLRKPLHAPKHLKSKEEKISLGSSVIIMNNAERRNYNHLDNQYILKERSKSSLANIYQMKKQIGHYLENKEFNINFERYPPSTSEELGSKIVVKKEPRVKYVNMRYDDKKHEKQEQQHSSSPRLPTLGKQGKDSEVIFPKRYKSKKVELALKSNSSEIIKHIRESMKEQPFVRHDFSFENYSKRKKESTTPLPLLNARQRKLIQILSQNRGYRIM